MNTKKKSSKPLCSRQHNDGNDQLEPPNITLSEFRRLGHLAVEFAAQHLESARVDPVFNPLSEEERLGLLEQKLPECSCDPEEILNDVVERVMTHPMGNGHPRWFGWVNSPPAPVGVIAELLAAVVNPSCAGGDHAAIYLEHCVIRWLMELTAYPTEKSMGILVSGGSMASLTGLAAARHWAAVSDGWDVRSDGLQASHPSMMLYVSEESHSCIHKAAELLGLGRSAVHFIPCDDRFKLDLSLLRSAVASDKEAGRRPFCVVANAGTVNTGAIDPLEELADYCEKQNLWLHVDGAYGAVGVLDPALSSHYAGLERAHSLALDPHKWFSVPIECGCVFVQDGQLLRDAFSLVPSYIRTEQDRGFGGLPWFSEYGFQQTRGFRALKLWMMLKHAGRSGLESVVVRHNELARKLAETIQAESDFELLAPVELSIVCFRYVPSGRRYEEHRLDTLNKVIMERVQRDGRVFVTNATLRGHFALRACVLHYATTKHDISTLVETVREVGTQVAIEMDVQ